MTVRVADEIFDFMTYPAGEPHVVISETVREMQAPSTFVGLTNAIIWDAHNFDDLALMVTAWRTLKRRFDLSKKFVVPYFPFGRHDRRRDEWDSDPLQMALDIVRPMLDENCLITIDPHSDVSGVIPHISQRSIVQHFLHASKPDQMLSSQYISSFDCIVIPDNGATKRAEQWLDLFPNAYIFQGKKHRDVRTGELTGFGVEPISTPEGFAKLYLPGGNVLIVDDICDGGGTFLGLAETFDGVGAIDKITLLTTHGLYTKGTEILEEKFDLWTLDVYNRSDNRVGLVDTKFVIRAGLQSGTIR